MGRIEGFQLYHKARDHLKSGKENEKNPACLVDIWRTSDYRVHLEPVGIIEEKVNEWDRIASGPKREHVPAEAECELWKSTYYLEQTTAGGADTVATTEHPDLPNAKDWHRERFRRQVSSTST